MKNVSIALALTVALAACSQPGADQSASTAAPKGDAAKGAPLDQPATPSAPETAAQMTAAKLDPILAGAWRSDANKARDKYRHPKETLGFFGVKPSDTLIEITPAGGWYAEILAPLMKGTGTYIAAVPKSKKPADEEAQDQSVLQKKFTADPTEYGEAKTVDFDGDAPNFGPPNSADVVVTFRNVHNWAKAGTAPQMFKAFFDVLKPGGVLGVVDHRAADGATLDKVMDSGYLPTDYVIKLATDAGFKLKAQSEVNANPKDTKDYEKGVWTLPPTFALKDQDHDKYAAIGESDRMTLKFVKASGDKIFQQGNDSSN